MRLIVNILVCLFLVPQEGEPQGEFLETMEKEMVKVGNRLYASKYETYNAQYNVFLDYLIENNRIQDLEIARPDSSQWEQVDTVFIPLAKFYRWHPAYSRYPAVNISYEAAVLYCDWLTEQYMAYPKKIFKEVKFRLPSEVEWVNAARGGLKDIIYPWGSNQVTNDEGVALCNFWQFGDSGYNSKDSKVEDFAISTVPVNSYFINGFGVYNMSGNVAEMTSRKGFAKGGSWRSSSEDVRIDARQQYDVPSPLIGFRVFMDVLEE